MLSRDNPLGPSPGRKATFARWANRPPQAGINEQIGPEAAVAPRLQNTQPMALLGRPNQGRPAQNWNSFPLQGHCKGATGPARIHGNFLGACEPQKAPVEIGRGRKGWQQPQDVRGYLVAVEIGHPTAGKRAPQAPAGVGIGDQGNAGFGHPGKLAQGSVQLQGRHHPRWFIPKDDDVKVVGSLAVASINGSGG